MMYRRKYFTHIHNPIFTICFHNKNCTHSIIMTFHNENEMEVQRSKVNFDMNAVETFAHGLRAR